MKWGWAASEQLCDAYSTDFCQLRIGIGVGVAKPTQKMSLSNRFVVGAVAGLYNTNVCSRERGAEYVGNIPFESAMAFRLLGQFSKRFSPNSIFAA